MRSPLVITWLLAASGACKPADEAPRRPLDPASGAPPITGPDLGPLPEGIAARATPAPPSIAPIEERARPPDGPDADEPPTAAPDSADAAEIAAPEPDPDAGGADAEDVFALADAEPGPEPFDAAPPTPETPEATAEDARWSALLPDLGRAPSADQQERARALNKSGLDKHRKSKWDDAMADYEAALAAWPGHPFSRYNLACALALRKRPDDALLHLRALAHLAATDPAAADRLRAARVDSDFAPLRADPRFRELTGATDILVAWTREDERAQAKRHVETLRNARWLTRAAPRAWNATEGLAPHPTLLYRADDAVATRVAPEVVRALAATVPELSAEPAGPLPPEAPPLVLWLPPPAPPDAAPPDTAPPPNEPGPVTPLPPEAPATSAPPPTPPTSPPGDPIPPVERLTAVKDFIGHRLVPAGPVAESLELKPTGFFVWVIGPSRPGDTTTTRTGRYQLKGPSLSLTFKETIETPTAGGPPRIEVHEGRTLTLLLTVPEPGTLAIEARPFHVR